MRPVSSAPMPASGSSSSSARGAVARHIAISSWRLAPWLSVDAIRPASPSRPAAASARVAIAMPRLSLAARSQTSHGRGSLACAARRQFSRTLNSAKIVVRW